MNNRQLTYQARESVSIGITEYREERLKHNAQRSIFDDIWGVNREAKSSKSMLHVINTGYPNLLHGSDFLCFNSMNF